MMWLSGLLVLMTIVKVTLMASTETETLSPSAPEHGHSERALSAHRETLEHDTRQPAPGPAEQFTQMALESGSAPRRRTCEDRGPSAWPPH